VGGLANKLVNNFDTKQQLSEKANLKRLYSRIAQLKIFKPLHVIYGYKRGNV
jgi:hypothetical protein